MNDPEVRLLFKRIGIGLFVCIVLLVPFYLFFYTKLNQDESKVVREIKKENTFFLYIKENKTPNSYKNEIQKQGVSLEIVNKDTSRDIPNILQELDLPSSDVVAPALIYIQEGKVVAILNEIKDVEELNTFVENYKGGIE